MRSLTGFIVFRLERGVDDKHLWCYSLVESIIQMRREYSINLRRSAETCKIAIDLI